MNIKLWEKNFELISGKEEKVKDVVFELLRIIEKEDWQGACHATSAIMYILFSELGIKSNIYIGEVKSEVGIFDHSWIEINSKIYDVAISNTLCGRKFSAPIIADYNLETLKVTNMKYGIKTRNGLDNIADTIKNIPIVDYINNSPLLLEIIYEISKKVGITFDWNNLYKKYLNIMRELK